MYYLLFYGKAPDYAGRQKPLESLHRAYVEKPVAEADLIFGDRWKTRQTDRPSCFSRRTSAAAVEAFAENDPYVKHGIVVNWRVRKWDVVVGSGARI